MKTWRERLAEGPTTADYFAALPWKTCAVGEQHRLHPEVVRYLTSDGPPADPVLRRLGGDFPCCLVPEMLDLKAAERTLDAIEDRVLELKREAHSEAPA